jgi:hypothetical protein
MPREFDRTPFEPWPEADGRWIARVPVEPIAVHPLGDLLELHARAGIELRFAPNIWPSWDTVISSGLPFSGVRLRNAHPAGAEGPIGPG